MSADLWEAFGGGDASANPWSQPSPREEKAPSQLLPLVTPESVEGVPPPVANAQHILPAAQSPWDSNFIPDLATESRTTNALHSNTWTAQTDLDGGWSDFVSPTRPSDPWAASRPLQAAEVLWDADEAIKEDDDFGEFENPAPEVSKLHLEPLKPQKQTPISKTAAPAIQKASFTSSSTTKRDSASASVPKGNQVGKTGRDTISSTSHNAEAQYLSAKEQLPEPEESWDEWSPDPRTKTGFSESSQINTISAQTRTVPSKTTISRSSGQSRSIPKGPGSSNPKQPTSSLPPTNIPPPSILISLLSSLISTLPAQVEAAMESFTSKGTPTEAADKALSTAVRKCLAALRVAARIVAGRKVRWKRDTHLSQSMSIGPAGGGGKSGMKLAGIDRNEIKREDREVAEFIIVWQNRLGSVRKALASVNSRIGDTSQSSSTTASKKLELPSISEVMLIKTVKEQDGGIKSPKACALCGVKREERVDKVDVDVFDGFGEWWFDHWGHAECRVFWYQHEKYLQQR